MSEVRTDGQRNGANTGGITLPPPADDPLASLHKMSTTAGLGSQEYVEINVTAVVALLLGISSVLALVLKLLLILPLAGIVCSILAIVQVRRSNGTQTGTGFAVAGLLLSLGFGGFVFASEGIKQMRSREDQQQIAALMQQFGADVAAKRYSDAYALCSERFHGRVAEDLFKARLEEEQRIPELGQLQSVAWNQEPIYFDTNADTAVQTGTAMAFLNFEKSSVPSREIMLFMKQGGSWRIDDIPQVFPTPRPGPGGAGAPGGPPGQGAPPPARMPPEGPAVPK